MVFMSNTLPEKPQALMDNISTNMQYHRVNRGSTSISWTPIAFL